MVRQIFSPWRKSSVLIAMTVLIIDNACYHSDYVPLQDGRAHVIWDNERATFSVNINGTFSDACADAVRQEIHREYGKADPVNQLPIHVQCDDKICNSNGFWKPIWYFYFPLSGPWLERQLDKSKLFPLFSPILARSPTLLSHKRAFSESKIYNKIDIEDLQTREWLEAIRRSKWVREINRTFLVGNLYTWLVTRRPT